MQDTERLALLAGETNGVRRTAASAVVDRKHAVRVADDVGVADHAGARPVLLPIWVMDDDGQATRTSRLLRPLVRPASATGHDDGVVRKCADEPLDGCEGVRVWAPSDGVKGTAADDGEPDHFFFLSAGAGVAMVVVSGTTGSTSV